MAGPDEAQARATLAAMQARLGQGPHVVFGLDMHASAEDVRTAFLKLTKVYHPAKFARLSVDLQRQSNEVFLGIKAALELINKAVQMPAVGTGRTNAKETPTPVKPGSQPIPTIQSNSQSKPTTPMRPVTPQSAQPAPISRPGTPPTATSQPIMRPGQQPGPARTPPTASLSTQRVAGPSAAPPVAVRFGGASKGSTSAPVVSGGGEREQLATAFEMIQKQQWDAAKTVLDALIAQAPDTRQYRALVCYAAGRRAQLEKRLDDARVELNQALMIDPDLTLAKSALAELFNRRK